VCEGRWEVCERPATFIVQVRDVIWEVLLSFASYFSGVKILQFLFGVPFESIQVAYNGTHDATNTRTDESERTNSGEGKEGEELAPTNCQKGLQCVPVLL
jgi:hypothetical protein